ncbi:MAG: glutathione S-transferase family protein [Gammaproteobacteria bacterium]|nr:glutathione S-transferase family protein [Gammaproteobacteria bacterium]
MQLIGRYLSPFVRRTAATLNLYGIPFESLPLQHTGDDAPTLRKSNPVGRVPALILDDGEVLIDSAAIIDYLDRKVGAARALTPADGADRTAVMRLTSVALGAVEKAIATAYEIRFRPEDKRHQPWVDRCAEQSRGGFEYLESQLQGDWFVGGKMSQADVTTAICWQFVGKATPKIKAAVNAPKLDALVERMMKLPAYSSTLPE